MSTDRAPLTAPGKRPPATISILFCANCGRDDQVTPFTGKSHYTRGEKCPGTPAKVTYEYPCHGAS